MEMAFVQIGLSPSEFWDLTWREFDYMVRHHENKVSHDWDIARTLGAWSIAPHSKKRINPSDLLKLPTDKKATNKSVPTREEFEKIKALYGKHG